MTLLDQSPSLEPGDLHVYLAGDEDPSEGGKTGVIHIAVPTTLALAVELYHVVKTGLFPAQAYDFNKNFFINMKEEPLSIDTAFASLMYKDMCAAMGLATLTITSNRHAVSTHIREHNLTGNLGTGHSEGTQDMYYNDHKEKKALYNKSRANQAIVEARGNTTVRGQGLDSSSPLLPPKYEHPPRRPANHSSGAPRHSV
jgi:hypothetical protein